VADDSGVRRILAAVDLTPMGRRVAERARLIAEETDASITLVHVVNSDASAFMSAEEQAKVRDITIQQAHDLAEWVRGRCSCSVDLVLPSGSASRHISHLAKQADVVLSGTSSLDAARVGPVTRRLARMARVGVVAVRRQPRVPYRRVLAAVDLSERSRQAVDLARRIAPTAEVTAAYAVVSRFDEVLAASGVSSDEIESMRNRRVASAQDAMVEFVSYWDDVKPLVVSGPPSTALAEAARHRSSDLVTVSSKGGGGDSMVLLGAVAEEVLEAAHCDVAVARVESVFRRP